MDTILARIDYISEITKIKLPFLPVEIPMIKRIFDILACLFILVILSPLIVFILAIFFTEEIFSATSRGPLFYTETRISKGLPFKVFKFRIFKVTVSKKYFEKHGFVQTKELEGDNNNLTLTGRLLKQIYMDELPQIFNVLIGDMTLVGPRPSNEVVTYEDGLAGRFQRFLFVGGLTGPFQAVKDAKTRPVQSEVDMAYIIYCKNNPGWKIILKDLVIMSQTILVVLRAKGI